MSETKSGPKEKAKEKTAAEPKDKPAEPKTEAKADAPKNYSRGEGQKAVTQAYKDNWNAIYGKKKEALSAHSRFKPWNSRVPCGIVVAHVRETAMLVERDVRIMNVEVIGEAYDIAAHFLKRTGLIADGALINERLLEIIHGLFVSGVRNRLLLANRAITKYERSRPIPIR